MKNTIDLKKEERMKRLHMRFFLAAGLILMFLMIPALVFSGTIYMSKDPGFVPLLGGVNANGFQPGDLIKDGSFEKGPPPGSDWTEWSNTPLCVTGIVNAQDVGWPPAYSEIYAYWAGGYCEGLVPISGYVEQQFVVPIDALTLRFETIFYRPDWDDPDHPDVFTVSINGTPVFSRDMIQANDTFPNWVEQTVDLRPYRRQFITLRIEAVSTGELTGNVLVDYITIVVPPAVPTLNEWGLILLVTIGGLVGVLYVRKKRKVSLEI